VSDTGGRRRARTRTIEVGALARVEGEGAMRVRVRDGRAELVEFNIYEPPRFFEALLAGRRFTEAPDITSRICGICPVAYIMSATAAMEAACGVEPTREIDRLRRLVYCGEWLESHGLHVVALHLPDFLGYDGVVAMARDHRELVERGLAIKKAGNELIAAIGGREIHPVNLRVGGFHRAPSTGELGRLRDGLERAREWAIELTRRAGELDFPELERDYTFVALRHPEEYAIQRGRVVASTGLDIPVDAYEEHFHELQVPHSTALHSRMVDGERPYLCGPLARWALNGAQMSPPARELAAEVGLEPVCRNPFRSLLVRCVEIFYALDEALRLLDGYEPPDPPALVVEPRAATGHGATEAPRGLLYQRYEISAGGEIRAAKIVPPTAQNQPSIEEDLVAVVEAFDGDRDALRHRCEVSIRNYDPCISCATHFLELEVERG